MQPEKALELLAKMQDKGLVPNVITHNAAISACEKGMKPEKALELLAEMQDKGLVPNVITHNAVISACEKGMKVEKALELLAEMHDKGLVPDVITYTTIILAWSNASQCLQALKMIEMAREAMIPIGHVSTSFDLSQGPFVIMPCSRSSSDLASSSVFHKPPGWQADVNDGVAKDVNMASIKRDWCSSLPACRW